jgi:hypothetical protein
MNKILIGIPVVTGAEHCRQAINSVIKQEIQLYSQNF